MAIITIRNGKKEIVGHIGRLDFDGKDISDGVITLQGYLTEGAIANFVESVNRLREDDAYEITHVALDPTEDNFILKEAVFYSWANPFAVGNTYIYPDALLAFKDKVPGTWKR